MIFNLYMSIIEIKVLTKLFLNIDVATLSIKYFLKMSTPNFISQR